MSPSHDTIEARANGATNAIRPLTHPLALDEKGADGMVAASRKRTVHYLKPGEAVPAGTPARYLNVQGYYRLRWKVAPYTYVEVYEHRVFDGRVTEAEHVHHINHNSRDNRPENLVPLTEAEHKVAHPSRFEFSKYSGYWRRDCSKCDSMEQQICFGVPVSASPTTSKDETDG